MLRTRFPSILEAFSRIIGVTAISAQVWLAPAGAATYDLENLFDQPEPQGSVRFVTPGAESGLDELQRADVMAAMEAFARERFDEMETIATRLTTTAPDAGRAGTSSVWRWRTTSATKRRWTP